MVRLIRFLGISAVRIFYRRIVVSGAERIPARGPVVVVANHPNGLLDPVLIGIALRRPVAMLAKSTLFTNAVGRAAMRAFLAIPVYRSMDAEDTARNEETFERCRALLAQGGWLALFPEGTSHSDSTLRPLKTGAARIVLSTEAAAGFGLGTRILPLGLLYESKQTFRSRAAVVVGEPIALASYADRFASDDRACVRELTAKVDWALSEVVIEAESRDLWRGLLAVAAWTAPDGGRDLAAREARARLLARAYRALYARDPARADAVVEEVQRFDRALRSVGVTDPFALEVEAAPARFLGATVKLLPLLPLAALGAALGWIPYRLVRPAARRLAGGHTDLVSTYKVLLGFVALLAAYVAEAIVAAVIFNRPAALAVLVAAPLLGMVAIRVGERLRLRRQALHAWWIRLSRGQVTRELSQRRRELCAEVEAALVASGGQAPR